jgi:hypothetical protein
MSTYRLPNEEWKYRQSLYSSFNNQLLAGHNQGLALYNYDTDTKLYKNTDYKPLDKVNFDTINNDLDKYDKNYNKQDDIYNNSKSAVAGVIAGINKSTDDTVDNIKNSLKNLFNFEGLKTYVGLFLLFLIVYKKI